MAIAPLPIKQHDLQPYYRANAGQDITDSTVCFTMVNSDGTKVIDRAAIGCVVATDGSGDIDYQWQNGDTDVAGTYLIEFEITPTIGGKFTIPSGKVKAQVQITADLDGV